MATLEAMDKLYNMSAKENSDIKSKYVHLLYLCTAEKSNSIFNHGDHIHKSTQTASCRHISHNPVYLKKHHWVFPMSLQGRNGWCLPDSEKFSSKRTLCKPLCALLTPPWTTPTYSRAVNHLTLTDFIIVFREMKVILTKHRTLISSMCPPQSWIL